MPQKAASLEINEVNLSFILGNVNSNVSGVIADCEFGPIGNVDTLFTTPEQFKRVHGGIKADNSNAASYNNCIRALVRGSSLRVCNIKHYTNPADSSTLAATKAAALGTKTYTISAALTSTDVLTATFGFGETLQQSYITSSAATIDAFLTKIRASTAIKGYSNILYAKRVSNSSTKFIIVAENPVDLALVITDAHNGKIQSVTITAAGTGGTPGSFAMVFSGGGGTGAAGTITVSGGGTVTVATVSAAGTGYTSLPTVTAPGFTGTGLSLTAVLPTIKTISIATSALIQNAAGDTLFSLAPKYEGDKYNSLTVHVLANAREGYFDIIVSLLNSSKTPEIYSGLKINNLATDILFLDKIRKDSELVVPVYAAATQTGTPTPVETFLAYSGAIDGAAIDELDILGDSSEKTGVYAFDGYDDLGRIACVIDSEDSALDSAVVESSLSTYATARKDLTHFAWLHGTNPTAVKAERTATNIDSSYSRFYADGLGLIVPISDSINDRTYIHALGDVLGAAAYSVANFKPWLSYAGQNRGQIINNLGVGNSWGADQATMDDFAKYQINLVVREDSKTIIKGNFTAQLNEDSLSYNSIRDLLIYMKKSLKPLAGIFLEEPNDIPTWKGIYLKIIPWQKLLEDGRGIQPESTWYGDQDANTLNDLVINTKSDVQLGKYKARFMFVPINSLQQFGIDLIIADSNVSFEEILPISNLNN